MKIKIAAIEVERGHEIWTLDGKTRLGIAEGFRFRINRNPLKDSAEIFIRDSAGKLHTMFTAPYNSILVERMPQGGK